MVLLLRVPSFVRIDFIEGQRGNRAPELRAIRRRVKHRFVRFAVLRKLGIPRETRDDLGIIGFPVFLGLSKIDAALVIRPTEKHSLSRGGAVMLRPHRVVCDAVGHHAFFAALFFFLQDLKSYLVGGPTESVVGSPISAVPLGVPNDGSGW